MSNGRSLHFGISKSLHYLTTSDWLSNKVLQIWGGKIHDTSFKTTFVTPNLKRLWLLYNYSLAEELRNIHINPNELHAIKTKQATIWISNNQNSPEESCNRLNGR